MHDSNLCKISQYIIIFFFLKTEREREKIIKLERNKMSENNCSIQNKSMRNSFIERSIDLPRIFIIYWSIDLPFTEGYVCFVYLLITSLLIFVLICLFMREVEKIKHWRFCVMLFLIFVWTPLTTFPDFKRVQNVNRDSWLEKRRISSWRQRWRE